MRGHFSIEWMAQSSQPAPPVPVPEACGTDSESLPGFYRRQDLGCSSEQQQRDIGVHRQNAVTSANDDPVVEADFSSGTEEETSGYESEGGRSLSPSANADSASASPPSPAVGRRPRTAFTPEQIGILERAFKRNAYLGTQDKAELCRKLNLSDKQIRNWFQNRRMKLKRTVQDALAHACQASVASHFMHYPELQAYRPGPYTPYQPETAAPVSYLRPHGLQYGSPLTAASPLPLDSFYQHGGLPGVLLPPTTHLRVPPGTHQTYPQYY
ncbi:ventrally expressed dharma/bozozok antagonist [Cololabis saira]|uniref:ventrally expressed dharma/bozozok antagonist n=1 Tax=Cololabis saira TaxID=129043 RepID=UPI002AD37E57|nr:ventrally expressed dharma/bozozok antagonist [Cololabis saira]